MVKIIWFAVVVLAFGIYFIENSKVSISTPEENSVIYNQNCIPTEYI